MFRIFIPILFSGLAAFCFRLHVDQLTTKKNDPAVFFTGKQKKESFSISYENSPKDTASKVGQQQEKHWVDSVFFSLSAEEKIAQLMVIRAHSNLGAEHVQEVENLIKTFNIGGLCFFQGGPVRQAELTNRYQSMAKTPLMICIDGEWGLGMRLDSVVSLPRQLMLGASNNSELAYEYGSWMGEQCKRMGIHVNYAPVVDVNNNPLNPVINDRSFGEDKFKVAHYGIQVMKGMQDQGVLACAKHFPGHGDVAVDSHYDLPIIQKSMQSLDSLELYPFKKIFAAGVGSVMIAHLYIPAIDTTTNLATSLSANNVTNLLRNRMGYQGISFTDALEMKGVSKFFPNGEAAVQSLIAGNDMLCLPSDIEECIRLVKKAIRNDKLSWSRIDSSVKKVLHAKYQLGLHALQPIDTINLINDLNAKTRALIQKIAEESFTIVKDEAAAIPFGMNSTTKTAYVVVGNPSTRLLADGLVSALNADVINFDFKQDLSRVPSIISILQKKYDQVIVGLHNYSRRPARNFGISDPAMELVRGIQALSDSIKIATVFFGNPYAAGLLPKGTILVGYEENEWVQQKALEVLLGRSFAKGSLPVSIGEGMSFGRGERNHYGSVTTAGSALAEPKENGENGTEVKTKRKELSPDAVQKIREICAETEAIGAAAGGVLVASYDGEILFQEAFGYKDPEKKEPVHLSTVYDLASVTKIAATTLGIMKLYEEKKIRLTDSIGKYLPWLKGSGKEHISLENLLLHQGGLVAWIPFYKETIDSTGTVRPGFYMPYPTQPYEVPVAEQLFMRKDWMDTMKMRIYNSPLSKEKKYVYSDNDFLFLGWVIEAVTQKPLDIYVNEAFYAPLGLKSIGFNPYNYMSISATAATEREPYFRNQLVRGYVHDMASAMFGGVAGHAGLFSDALDLWVLFEMLRNGGKMGPVQFFKRETIDLFTSYGTAISRRGLGFDKPEKDNSTRNQPYPSALVSPFTYGHTGFTGTCVWVDPAQKVTFVFLSNRICPDGTNTLLLTKNIRGRLMDAFLEGLPVK